MAFRELSQKELELLTDSQREIYDKKLAIHHERVKFVENLEKMEHVQIEPFQPTLDPIPAITKAPEKNFVKAEHRVVQVRGVKAAVVEVRPKPVPLMEKAILPQVARSVKARVVSVDKEPSAAPVLPVSRSLQIPRGEFKAEGPVKAQLHTVAAVRSPEVSCRIPEAVKAELPAGGKAAAAPAAKARIPSAEQMHARKPSLPKVHAAVPKERTFRTDIPKMTALPAAAVTNPADITYVSPDVSVSVPKPISGVVSPEKIYRKPEPVHTEVPAVTKVRARERTYQTPKIRKAQAPTEQPVSIPVRTFEQPAPLNAQVAYPASVNTPKIDYQKREYEMQQLPAGSAVSVPDPRSNEILHALLLRAKNK